MSITSRFMLYGLRHLSAGWQRKARGYVQRDAPVGVREQHHVLVPDDRRFRVDVLRDLFLSLFFQIYISSTS